MDHGLVGALLVGVSYAKALAYAINRPLVGVNHIEGHIAANYITYKELKPPFLCVMTSRRKYTELFMLKHIMNLRCQERQEMMQQEKLLIKQQEWQVFGYPGGPKVDKLAKEGQANIDLPKTHFEGDTLDFSFSGIKTAVINLHHKNPNINKADLCASFEKNVTETLLENIEKAIEKTGIKTIALAGGVSANSYIRKEFLKLEEKGIKVYMPDMKLCTDNAAMIASAGYYNYISGKRDGLELNAIPNLKIN